MLVAPLFLHNFLFNIFTHTLEAHLPNVHVLHAVRYLAVVQKGAVEGDNVGVVAVVHDLELAKDLLSHCRLCVDMNDLLICTW